MKTTAVPGVTFDETRRLFVLQLKSGFYALRVLPDGRLLHVGFGPRTGAVDAAALGGLDQYEEPDYNLDGQGARYELPVYGDVTYHEVAIKASLAGLAAPLQAGESAHVPVRDLRPRYQGHEIRTDVRPALSAEHGRPTRDASPRQTLCVRLKDALYDVWITLYYRLTPDFDVMERWVELENRGETRLDIERLAFATLTLRSGRYELSYAAGAWAREFVIARQALQQGSFALTQYGINTGHASNPFFIVNELQQASEDAGTVYFGALAYSGNWALQFESMPTGGLRIHGGYESSDFSLSLARGERHVTPAMAFGCCADGWGGASRRMHQFIRQRVLPGYGQDAYRPVLYNSWEAAYFNLSQDHQIELARKAAAIGVELFCIDDGWFGARRHDRAGLGDWVVSKEGFPNGLGPLIAEVKRLGMTFGLWVEPEMVNPDSDLYRAHPDWVLHFPGRPRTESRHQLILDFGRTEVVEYIHAVLDRLMRDNDVAFLKWDMNRYATEPGSVAGRSIWRRHVEGVYSIIDRLRRAHPNLDIETCASGGGRVDLGILQRTDQAWTSDNTDAWDRTRIQDGYSLIYPARTMEAWVTHERNHTTGRPTSLDLRFDVAMRGALGIGTSLDQMTPPELDACKRKIAFYKRIRPIVQEGDLYRLSTAGEGGVSAWQFVSPDGNRSAYSIVVLGQLLGLHLAPPRLRGLNTQAIYAVTGDSGAELGRFPGAQLMTLGLPRDSAAGGWHQVVRSRTVLIERANP